MNRTHSRDKAATPSGPLRLKDVLADLLADGHIPKDAGNDLLAAQRSERADQHPLALIHAQKWRSLQPPHAVINMEFLIEWLAGKAGLTAYHIDPLKIDVAAVTEVMSQAYASRYRILPVEVNPNEVVVATAEPYVHDWEEIVQQVARRPIRRVIASPLDLNRYIAEFYSLALSVKQAVRAQEGAVQSGITNFEQLVALGRMGQLDANDQSVVRIVDWLLQYAFEQRASDIHIEPRREFANVRFRIDGVLHPVYQIPSAVYNAITSRIKLLGRMDMVEKRRPQDGRVKTVTPGGDEIELRLSTMPTAFGEKLVMRIFDPEVLVRNFTELGFSDDEAKRWEGMVSHPNGIVLVTGPTGSGKTTTLYTSLKQLAEPEVNVCTVEDPIEMVVPQFNQMQVQPGIGLDFASGIRTLMRQDPDIIMVGEIRDLETAEMAIQAALTGHLVLSTLHTNDAPSAITRLMDLGVPPYLIQSTVLGVLAQRLVRTLCPHCKQATTLDDDTWSELVRPWKAPKPATVYGPVGCLECRMTGYRGRSGIYEILTMTPAVTRLITAQCDLSKLRETAFREGMKALRVSGAAKVAAGITTPDEILKVTPPPFEA
ncbi:MAG: type II secretion system protein E [Betaproteobacteria bacterium RBG_16_58_11]|nr:MAG: type II secretion system protein E [Betaproteobacteria bacterium RBG_16_58_11]